MTEKIPRSSIIFILFLIVLSILLFSSMTSPVHRWGDASTYYMQISSIVEDHDIQYQPIDLQRALHNKFDDLPAGVFLIRTASGTYFFGKEFSYALFAAPFFALLGIQGILVFNALMFWTMILMGFLYLREKGNSDIIAFGTSLIFFTLSAAFVYIFWVHAEIYNMFLLTLGLFLWTKYYEKPGSEKFLLCSAFIFGLATVSRIPNGLLFLPFLFYEIYSRRFTRVLSLFILFMIPILLFYGYFYSVTGITSFYGGDQFYYSSNYPFSHLSASEPGQIVSAIVEPAQNQMTRSNSLVQEAVNRFTFINYADGMDNLINYFFGRFTGLMWYYPLAVFALISFLILGIRAQANEQKNVIPMPELRKNPARYLILTGIILNILFFLFVNGSNYFGGQSAVGNRYFWVYPAFLFLIGRINLKLIIPFILIALVTVVPVISDPVSNSQNPQNHTFVLPYPLFPLEYNQVVNLPLWFPQPALQNMSFLYTGSEGGVVPKYLGSNTYSISGTSHWIVQNNHTIDHVTMIFLNAGKEESKVSAISGNYSTHIVINNTDPIKISIPLKQPEYSINSPLNSINSALNEISVSSTREIVMMVVSNETENQEILYSYGWFDEEKNDNQSLRWMTNHSTLLVYSDYEQNKSIQFDARSFNRPNHLNLQVDGNNYIYTLNPENYSTITSPLHLDAGYTVVQYNVLEGCSRPSDYSELNSDDTRCLSLNVRNMSLREPLPSTNESEKHEILYSEGWFDEEKDQTGSWRWMTNHSTVFIYSDTEQNKTIQFDGLSFATARDLAIHGDGYYQVIRLNPENYTSITSTNHLKAGYNALQFDVPRGCTRPSDNIGMKTNDTRCLSILIRNMTIL